MSVTDPQRIKSVFGHPMVWPHVGDDHSPAVEDWQPTFGEGIHYLMPDNDSACFMVHAHTRLHWEVHSAVLPEYRSSSREIALQVVPWMKQNTDCKVLSTYVPRGNFAAAALAKACGFQKVGIVPKSIRKNGMDTDQTLYVMEI